MKWIKLSEPDLSCNIQDDISRALENKEVGYVGSYVDSFGKKIRDYLNHPFVGLFSSGTASLHLAMILAGVKRGEEVICQSMTFAASANPIVYQGARPVFVGSESESWNMSPKYLEKALEGRLKKGKKVKAIIPVHLYGMPAKMKEILEIAAHYGVPVIEDAAEALGAKYDDDYCGTLGNFGVLSFNANKMITSGGGGALLTQSEKELERSKFFALQAKDLAPHYEHSQLGFNYAFSNLNAVLGNGQMDFLSRNINKRRRNFHIYQSELKETCPIDFQNGEGSNYSNRWLTGILLKSPELQLRLREQLGELKIETRPLWKPMHKQPFYRDCPYYGEQIEYDLFLRGLCLPSGSGLLPEEVNYVAKQIKNIIS
ncbi:DegT/DnrJ/EryC1/StrS family aminotransferase [Echinicola jeungdonensis]|uniref:DegT/DnrJ/EryC1/StrS family aminotransferase n=1 Tax=Echinicola jeungdonensis TaxID=709343 RepID=A0ABV5J843_9BACT|nr:DegT/DnrJ/EryC1/StrS family aminotransferase [Echinicola jeungdonensis]MDN3669932.1 DegT/DnrJ/EryC1/StrS family aminotransferase [Echinicola jeungdonensis]